MSNIQYDFMNLLKFGGMGEAEIESQIGRTSPLESMWTFLKAIGQITDIL